VYIAIGENVIGLANVSHLGLKWRDAAKRVNGGEEMSDGGEMVIGGGMGSDGSERMSGDQESKIGNKEIVNDG
jgi:hypothetical protein